MFRPRKDSLTRKVRNHCQAPKIEQGLLGCRQNLRDAIKQDEKVDRKIARNQDSFEALDFNAAVGDSRMTPASAFVATIRGDRPTSSPTQLKKPSELQQNIRHTHSLACLFACLLACSNSLDLHLAVRDWAGPLPLLGHPTRQTQRQRQRTSQITPLEVRKGGKGRKIRRL